MVVVFNATFNNISECHGPYTPNTSFVDLEKADLINIFEQLSNMALSY